MAFHPKRGFWNQIHRRVVMELDWVLAALILIGGAQAAVPLPASTNLTSIDFNEDGFSDFTHRAVVEVRTDDIALVGSSLIPRLGADILLASPETPLFAWSGEISTSCIRYTNSLTGARKLPISTYIAQLDPIANVWYFFSADEKAYTTGMYECFVGVLVTFHDEPHLGWVRFSRPDLNPETLFSVSGYDWNPIPGAPIRAGLPPEIPVATEVLPEGAGIRLSWSAGVSNWMLESTRSLSPPVVWERYPTNGTHADVPREAAGYFFRLRRPE